MLLMDPLNISLSGPSTVSIVAIDGPPVLNMAAIDSLPDNDYILLVKAMHIMT